MTTSLHDLRGMARGARKRLRRAYARHGHGSREGAEALRQRKAAVMRLLRRLHSVPLPCSMLAIGGEP